MRLARITGERSMGNGMAARGLGLWGGLLAALTITAAWPVAAEEPAAVVTHHHILLAGKPLAYSAEAGRIPIRDVATGEALGQIFYVAYRLPAKPGQVRPITFVWNGGPGLPAASTHFEGAGPRRIAGARLVDNADTWLTDSDLVFVDPVGTGFSRAVSVQAQEAFTSIVGDVAANTEFVRAWVLRHGAEDTPLVISGQSYAAGRAGSVAYQLLKRGFKVRGLALVSNTQGLPRYPEQGLIAPAMHVGDYAVAALYYHKLPPDLGTTPDAARAEAERWARAVYLPALRRRDSLSDAERQQVRNEFARHIGYPAAEIDLKTLSITQSDFLGHLVPGKLPYYSDYREIEPYHAPPLNLGVRYIRHDLGYASDLPYFGVEPIDDGFAPNGVYPKPVNATWTHSTIYGATHEQLAQAEAEFEKTGAIGMASFGPRLPGAAEAIQLEPKLKVLVAHAAYDPLGGCSMDAELGRRLEPPYRQAVTFRCYLAGHAIYRDAPARAQFAADMRALAKQASGATP
jgi:Serine carboxypeptidase